MSAEVLREAAAKMRDLAQGADFQPWEYVGPGISGELGEVARTGIYENGVYIASWHPAVALAVADWLDATADRIANHHEMRQAHQKARSFDGDCGCAMKDCWDCGYWHDCEHVSPRSSEALAVARAYLRRDT